MCLESRPLSRASCMQARASMPGCSFRPEATDKRPAGALSPSQELAVCHSRRLPEKCVRRMSRGTMMHALVLSQVLAGCLNIAMLEERQSTLLLHLNKCNADVVIPGTYDTRQANALSPRLLSAAAPPVTPQSDVPSLESICLGKTMHRLPVLNAEASPAWPMDAMHPAVHLQACWQSTWTLSSRLAQTCCRPSHGSGRQPCWRLPADRCACIHLLSAVCHLKHCL